MDGLCSMGRPALHSRAPEPPHDNSFLKEVRHDISCLVAIAAVAEKPGQEREILPDSRERRFHCSVTVALPKSDRRDQAVAHATSLGRLLQLPALAHVSRGWLGRAPVADLTIRLAVRHAQIARLADPSALGVNLGFRDGPR